MVRAGEIPIPACADRLRYLFFLVIELDETDEKKLAKKRSNLKYFCQIDTFRKRFGKTPSFSGE